MILLGYDIGSSSVKATLVDGVGGAVLASDNFPKTEAEIISPQKGWAEQEPESWWNQLKEATASVLKQSRIDPHDIGAIGISYQMHGLVCVDRNLRPLRPSIIWCDGRAVGVGERAAADLGGDYCLQHLLNLPGNFTAAKLAWVKQNQPDIYRQIYKVMLPGDYIAMRLTGEPRTTVSGLSEGMLWDYKEGRVADFLLRYWDIDPALLPEVVPTFGIQGRVTAAVAQELGLAAGIPVCYRAGDQPNNALSLNVFNPGEIASTAGTSGVVYGVNEQTNYDPQSRVNNFVHVNHTTQATRLGVLLCINGTGILNAWTRRMLGSDLSYAEVNDLAAQVPVGSEGITILPFGNGPERMLCNKDVGCRITGIDFNRHTRAHLMRAAQEGIAFAMRYGIDIMQAMGIRVDKIHAGNANMFLSPVFRQTLANATGATIELLDTDGAAGAARGAGLGAGFYRDTQEAFGSLQRIATITPDADAGATLEVYQQWNETLKSII